jgi:hypothetical protein
MVEETDSKELRTGNYTIELSDGPSVVYKLEQHGAKEWVCTCPSPEAAMTAVEGLILVENKRFYHPETTPTVKFDEQSGPPGFLKLDTD